MLIPMDAGKYQVETALKARLKACGLGYRDLAAVLGDAPNTVSQRLNGWQALGEERRRKIIERIEQEEAKK